VVASPGFGHGAGAAFFGRSGKRMDNLRTDRERDALFGVAIVALVGAHSTASQLAVAALDVAAGRAVALAHLLSLVGVPLLFAVSAFGLAQLRSEEADGPGCFALVRQGCRRLLPAYMFWGLATLALEVGGAAGGVERMVGNVFRGRADEHFPIVLQLFALGLGWPLLRRVAAWAGRSAVASVVVVVAGFAATFLWWDFGASYGIAAWDVWNLPAWSAYLGLGLVAAARADQVIRVVRKPRFRVGAAAAAGASLWLFYRGFIAEVTPDYQPDSVWAATSLEQVPAVGCAVGFIVLVAALIPGPDDRLWRKLLVSLGQRSYGIYLVHLLVLRHFVQPVFPPYLVHGASPVEALALVGLSWVACLLGSFLLVATLARLPFGRFLAGEVE
jgi:peptidoglycan/LPS O-acetylase OafA/YrhL